MPGFEPKAKNTSASSGKLPQVILVSSQGEDWLLPLDLPYIGRLCWETFRNGLRYVPVWLVLMFGTFFLHCLNSALPKFWLPEEMGVIQQKPMPYGWKLLWMINKFTSHFLELCCFVLVFIRKKKKNRASQSTNHETKESHVCLIIPTLQTDQRNRKKRKRKTGLGEETVDGDRKRRSQIWALPTMILNFKNPLSLLLKRTIQRFAPPPPLPKACCTFIGQKDPGKFQSLMHENSPRAQEGLFCWIVMESPLLHV